MMSVNPITVITGPSGVVKGSLVKKLIEIHADIWLSISATTRLPREGERDGEHYFFLEEEAFRDLIKKNGFLEWTEFAGNFYGTPKNKIDKQLSLGKKVLLEIELEGARQVRRNIPDAFQIFITPPSLEELEKRIRGRGTESEEAIQRRLKRAKQELNAQNEFDAVVVNDDLDLALLEIERLIGFT